MKQALLILFLFTSTLFFSQKRILKKIETIANEIEISTFGLDDFVIENSESNFIEVFLFAEDSSNKYILFNEENNVMKVEFNNEEFIQDDPVFRKFITKRLQRAKAIIKVPKGKTITILGNDINITSKNYKGELNVFIEKGILKLNKIQSHTNVKMYAGNIYASIKETSLDITSNIGEIKIDGIVFDKTVKKENEKFTKLLTVNAVKANIFLTSLKTQ